VKKREETGRRRKGENGSMSAAKGKKLSLPHAREKRKEEPPLGKKEPVR